MQYLLHDEFPHGHAREVEQNSRDEHGNDTRYPAQNAQAPTLRHDGQAHLVACKQPSGLLPRHGAKLDIVSMVFFDESIKCQAIFIRIRRGRIDDLIRCFFVRVLEAGHGERNAVGFACEWVVCAEAKTKSQVQSSIYKCLVSLEPMAR